MVASCEWSDADGLFVASEVDVSALREGLMTADMTRKNESQREKVLWGMRF